MVLAIWIREITDTTMLAIWIREITGHHDVCHMEKSHHDVGHKDKKAYWTLRCWPYGRDRIQKTIMLAMWKRENTGHHHVGHMGKKIDHVSTLLVTCKRGYGAMMPVMWESKRIAYYYAKGHVRLKAQAGTKL